MNIIEDIATTVFSVGVGFVIGMYLFDGSDKSNARLCEYSKFATPHYKLIDDVIYCKSSDNSYQMLQKHKPKSDHNKEHQR